MSDSKQMHPVVYCAMLPLCYEPDLLLKCGRLQESIYHFLFEFLAVASNAYQPTMLTLSFFSLLFTE